MGSQTRLPKDEGSPELNLFGSAAARFSEYGSNASSNLRDAFASMTTQSWIRLTVIVGGYMLMRPYLMKWASKGAVQSMEESDVKEKQRLAEITPNELRGVKEQLDAQEYEDNDAGDAEATGANWGMKARTRQRTMIKQLLEEEERRRAEEEDDKDIQEFLED